MIEEGRRIFCDRCGLGTFDPLNEYLTYAYGKPVYENSNEGWTKTRDGLDLCPACTAILKNTSTQVTRNASNVLERRDSK